MSRPQRVRSALCAAVLCTLALAAPAKAGALDFAARRPDETFSGVWIRSFPDRILGTFYLGNRVLRPGDALTPEQMKKVRFVPAGTTPARFPRIRYLPVFSHRVAGETEAVFSFPGKRNLPPDAEDLSMETYRNLPNSMAFRASDPEAEELTFEIVRPPRQGTVEILPGGTFCFTPRHNRVGTDSFTYAASDPAGNRSREALVRIQILRPKDSSLYADTTDRSCRFAAEWMKNTGLFSGETLGGVSCFCPDQPVTQGQFLALAMEVLHMPVAKTVENGALPSDLPLWLQPYWQAARRWGLIRKDSHPECPVTSRQARQILDRALEIALPGNDPSAACEAISPVFRNADISVPERPNPVLCRGDVSMLFYALDNFNKQAP